MEAGGWYRGWHRCLMDALYPQRFLFPLESGITPEIVFLSPEDLELSALHNCLLHPRGYVAWTRGGAGLQRSSVAKGRARNEAQITFLTCEMGAWCYLPAKGAGQTKA